MFVEGSGTEKSTKIEDWKASTGVSSEVIGDSGFSALEGRRPGCRELLSCIKLPKIESYSGVGMCAWCGPLRTLKIDPGSDLLAQEQSAEK